MQTNNNNMANTQDFKYIVKHLAEGTLAENLCIICLAPLKGTCENIFTKVCKEDKEYCIADVLETVCQIKFSEETDNYSICIECFITASAAYKFFLLAKRTQEILTFYTDHLTCSFENVFVPEDMNTNIICFALPAIALDTVAFDYDLSSVGVENYATTENIEKHSQKLAATKDDEVVVIIQENAEMLFYKVLENGQMVLLDDSEKKNYKEAMAKVTTEKKSKGTRRRQPMAYRSCSRCPVKYRFTAKLKQHMKIEHNVELYVCKVCRAITEDQQEYHSHLKTHTNIHQCALCDTVFKKRETIITHLKWHEKINNLGQSANAHICETCGVILESAASLAQHWDARHCKRYTCYYCGRRYRGEISFEMHVRKHEQADKRLNIKTEKPVEVEAKQTKASKGDKSKGRCACAACGRHFVDQRSLMWHQRLHDNEKPYVCDVCGRAFVSLNRRNQHWQCAHTAPARRCPLCPALFHLRSMVNTHIKKVHLNAHKRRNRTSKYQNVYWRTEPVPIQELSVAVQNQILELQAAAAPPTTNIGNC